MKKIPFQLFLLLTVLISGLLFVSCDPESESSSDSNGTGGSMARFTCVGDYLYVVENDKLQTYDIRDSARILLTNVMYGNWSNRIETIFPVDSLLFLGSQQGMYICSIRRPAKPEVLSLYSHITSCDPVVVKGKYAYLTLRTGEDFMCSRGVNRLEVIDVSDLSNPKVVSQYDLINPRGLAIDGNLLFVCDGMDLLEMDASDPLQLHSLKRIELDSTPYDVIAKNGVLTLSYLTGVRQYSYVGGDLTELSVLY